MSDATNEPATTPKQPGFPFITVSAAVGVLFVFLFLMWLTVFMERPVATPTMDSSAAKIVPNLDEVKARNEAALNGVGAKMSLQKAHDELLPALKKPSDTLPFPTPEPPVK